MSQRQCEVDGCQKRAEPRRRYCRGHRERLIDGKPLSGELRPYGQKPRGPVREAIINLIGTDEMDELAQRRAWQRIWTNVNRYAKRLAKRRPSPGVSEDDKPH